MKQPILLLHGALGAANQMEPLGKLLANSFSVHFLNFPGDGGAAMPEADYSMELFASETLAFIERQGFSETRLFGYSMGGYVAAYLACHFPERITGIFTLGSKWDWTPEIAETECRMLNPEKIEEKVPAFAEALRLRHAPNDWKLVLKKTGGLLKNLGEQPALTEAHFSKIACPAVIALADSDNMVTLQESRRVADWIPGGLFVGIPESFHPIEKVKLDLLAAELTRKAAFEVRVKNEDF